MKDIAFEDRSERCSAERTKLERNCGNCDDSNCAATATTQRMKSREQRTTAQVAAGKPGPEIKRKGCARNKSKKFKIIQRKIEPALNGILRP
jgi:hypothetical protein